MEDYQVIEGLTAEGLSFELRAYFDQRGECERMAGWYYARDSVDDTGALVREHFDLPAKGFRDLPHVIEEGIQIHGYRRVKLRGVGA